MSLRPPPSPSHEDAAKRPQRANVLELWRRPLLLVGADADPPPPPPLPPPPPPPPPPAVVPERGGPWLAMELDPAAFPALQTTLPLTVVYKRESGGDVPHLLVAESALLRRAKAAPGLGVYALRRFKGPRELSGRRVEGDEIGHYGGKVVAAAPTQREANEAATQLAAQGSGYLLTMRLQGHLGWFVVDGIQEPVLPFLHRANDPRGTTLQPRCVVSEYGRYRADRDIPALDWTRPLRGQVVSEITWQYGESYWSIHGEEATEPVGASVALLEHALDELCLGTTHPRPRASVGVAVEARPSTVAGVGLFAAEAIPAGTVVAEMGDPARMRRAAWDVYHEALDLPHDAAIHVARSPLVFYDQAWSDPSSIPMWYRQNHAREGVANVRMRLANPGASPHNQRLVWRTTRAVAQGEELRFTYTDVPTEWNL